MLNTFKEVMDEIAYSWNECKEIPELIVLKPDRVVINQKLVLQDKKMTYKEMTWELAPGLYEKARTFAELFL